MYLDHAGDLQSSGRNNNKNTKLMWEKKDDNNMGGIHEMDDPYSWDDAISVFIDNLNNTCNGEGVTVCTAKNQCGAGEVCGFAGHRDWRLPNVKELQSIVNFQNDRPAVSSEFNTECVTDCTTCSCTADPSFYWSSTSDAFNPGNKAWGVGFHTGLVASAFKSGGSLSFVRAVRGGF